jgi:fibronectin type 3 domain-containing protein
VALSWTASPTASVTGYRILRSSGGGYSQIGTVSGRTTTAYTDTSVSGLGSTYDYEVVAVAPSGTATSASAAGHTPTICL